MSLYTSKLQKAIHPDFLKDITIKGLHQMCNDYRRLPRYEKRCLCAHIVDNYHVQKNVKDPLLAAHELMQRLVYEVCMFCMFLHALHAKHTQHKSFLRNRSSLKRSPHLTSKMGAGYHPPYAIQTTTSGCCD